MHKVISSCLLSIGLLAQPLAHAHSPSAHTNHQAPTSAPAEQNDWGIAGDAKKVTRTIEIRMTDNMRFSPNQIQVKRGRRSAWWR